jgi:hypothetical protein
VEPVELLGQVVVQVPLEPVELLVQMVALVVVELLELVVCQDLAAAQVQVVVQALVVAQDRIMQ